MKTTARIKSLLIILAFAFSTVSAQLNQSAFKPKAAAFRLEQVQLLESPFKRAMLLDAEVLLKIKPDRLLHNFRKNANLEPKDKIYGGWESRGVAGHTLGHYLSAISMYYASTGDKRFLERINYIVDELAECQKANGDGYVSGIPDGAKIFKEISTGKIETKNPFDLNGGWVPFYTMHKLFAGLLDANEFAKNQKALEVAAKLADWTDKTTANLSEEQMQKILYVEQGGIMESLAEISVRTNSKKYLELSKRFYHDAVMNPLANGDGLVLQGLHANMQIPKIIGAARLYEISGDQRDEKIAETFWTEVVNHHTYVNGGNTDREHFGKRDEIASRMSGSMTETCNTYNMLKLTRHLFEWNPRGELFDYYERALYNQILTSQDPKTGLGGYKLGLYGGYFQPFSTLEDSFWCCTGSGFENHVKYNDSIYFHGENDLYVNLFMPSILNWSEKGLVLKQETKFPDEQTTAIVFEKIRDKNLTLKVRRPAWATKGVKIKINGKEFAFEDKAESYISINRKWKKGDRIEINFPFDLRIERTPDNPNRVALLYGPIVLAGLLGTENFPLEGPYGQEGSDGWKLPLPKMPKLAKIERPINDWIKPVAGKSLTFKTSGSDGEEITLVPLFRSQYNRMTVYWDVLTDAPNAANE